MHKPAFSLARRSLMALTVVSMAGLMAACATVTNPVSVADTVAARPELSTLNGLLVATGLATALQGAGPFTLFAPTNDAFKAVPAKTMADLAANPDLLKAVLSYHVVPSKLLAADIANSKVKTLNGASAEISKAGTFVTIEDAAVVSADIVATNGVVHTIDGVLLPPKK